MRQDAVYSAGVLEKVLEEGRWEAGPRRDCARSVVMRVSADARPLPCVLPVTLRRVDIWTWQDSAKAWQGDQKLQGGGGVVIRCLGVG